MIEPTLVTKLKTLCARVYPDVAPEGTAMPFITFQQVGGVGFKFYEGPSAKKNSRMQINVNAATRAESMTLIRAIEDLLITDMQADPIGAAVAEYVDAIVPIYVSRQDFSLWG
jgi:hypothetical protein